MTSIFREELISGQHSLLHTESYKSPNSIIYVVICMVMPLNVLEKSMNKRVSLVLKDSRILEGKLVGYDDYMNMVLEETEENDEGNVRRLGTVVLRGNNVVSIAPK